MSRVGCGQQYPSAFSVLELPRVSVYETGYAQAEESAHNFEQNRVLDL